MIENFNIVILAAGDIRNKFSYVKNNCSSPALIPVNTKPLANYVIENLTKLSGAPIFLTINFNVKDEVARELSEVISTSTVSLVTIDESVGVNDSLYQALHQIPEKEDTVVLLVTTIPESIPVINEVFIDEQISTNEDWSLIEIDTHHHLKFNKKSQTDIVQGHAFSGYFRVNTKILKDHLQSSRFDPDLLSLVQALHNVLPLQFTKTSWCDCGHEMNYYKAKKQLINSRSFNKIQVTENDSLIKISHHAEKLKDEISYVEALPISISTFFPRLYDAYDLEDGRYAYEMSYYGFPNIAELALYWNLAENSWRTLFHKFDNVLHQFSEYKFTFSKEQHTHFYFDKFLDRSTTFKASLTDDLKTQLFSESLTINGLTCTSFNSLIPFISQKIDDLFSAANHCIMHGDFCFNNILYDLVSNQIKLIDARGSFSSDYKGIYGDQLYDLAKLMHSSVYGYDYLVNDLFTFEQNGTTFNFSLNWRSNRFLLESLTNELIQKLKYSREEVTFVVGLLFLSMTPLHNESKNRQIVMHLHGLKIINEIYNGYKKNMS